MSKGAPKAGLVVEKKEAVKQGRLFCEKFFEGDPLAKYSLTLLKPQFRQCDLSDLIIGEPYLIGKKMLDIGEKLKEEGSFPGGFYVHEDCIEVKTSVEKFKKSLEQVTCYRFKDLLKECAAQAEAGFGSLGTWFPRLAALRWLCAMWWLAARAKVVDDVSAGSCFGTIKPEASNQACYDAKNAMLKWINELIHEAPLLKVFDHDLLGYGVYMNRRAEPLPRGGENEWFRRQMQLDLASLCRQVKALPPESLNVSEPRLHILRPLGELTWMLPPPHALRAIIEKHGWVAQTEQPPLDGIPAKALIQGLVMHMCAPPPVEWDYKDPEIIAKLQRGEKLGKGAQEDGLPGALHGSIGLLYAGIVGVEEIVNVKLYPDILEIDDFLESFLKYTSRLTTLDLSGAEEVMDEEFLTFLPMCGSSLRILDLEKCNLNESHVDTLVDTCEALTGLQHIDLAYNNFDAPSATMLLAALAERRVDLQTVRLDGNPVGDTHEFRQDVAGLLAARGDQVVAGGELVLYLNVDGVRWFAEAKADTLAARRRDDTLMMAATSFDELTQGARARNSAMDQMFREGKDQRTQCQIGRERLQKQRNVNDKILVDPLLTMYNTKIADDPEKKG